MSSHVAGISSMATRQILADLVPPCEQRTGCRIAIQSMGGVEAARRIRAGEPTDIIVLASTVMQQLETEGYVVAESRAAFAHSGIAMAVRSGARRPSVKDEASVKQAILRARMICYSSGPSGDHLIELWRRWGIAEIISSRAMQAPPGVPVGTLLAGREADLGFQQLSELLHLPGIEVIGPLPPEIQATTLFSAGVCSGSSKRDEARAVVAYLASGEADAAKRRHGMEPAGTIVPRN
jgi:molybdate transport system substrate-binding protein